MTDTANLQIKVHSNGTKKATAELDALAKQSDKTEKATKRAAKASKQAGNALGGFGRSAGQAGIQIQQFVGQVQGGQSAMLALSQQGADLGFVLGAPLVGAVVGISASLLGIFAPALFGASDKVEELTDKLKELANVQGLTKEQVAVLVQEEKKAIAASKEKIALLNEELKSHQTQLENQDKVIDNYDKESKVYKNLIAARKKIQESINEVVADRQLESQSIEKSNDKIQRYNALIGGEGLKAQDSYRESTDRVKQSLEQRNIALTQGTEAAQRHALAVQFGVKTFSELPDEIKKLVLANQELEAAQKRVNDEMQAEKAKAGFVSGLQTQIIALEDGAKAAMEYQAALRFGVDANGELEPAIQNAIDRLYELKEAQKTVTDEAAKMGQAIQQNLVQGLGDAVAGAIVDANNFGEAIKALGRNVIRQAISSMVQLGIQESVLSNMRVANKAKETSAAVAQAAAISTAMTPAAAAATIATGGTNLASAQAMMPLFSTSFSAMMASLMTPGIGRSAGGDLQAGQRSYVAENGMEVFMPNQGGRVFKYEDLERLFNGNQGGQNVSFVMNVQENIDNWLDSGGYEKIARRIQYAGEL